MFYVLVSLRVSRSLGYPLWAWRIGPPALPAPSCGPPEHLEPDVAGLETAQHMIPFVKFMSSTTGRIVRIVAGVVLIAAGLLAIQGTAGIIVAVVGVPTLLAGVFDFCASLHSGVLQSTVPRFAAHSTCPEANGTKTRKAQFVLRVFVCSLSLSSRSGLERRQVPIQRGSLQVLVDPYYIRVAGHPQQVIVESRIGDLSIHPRLAGCRQA